jgi:hypothetical protein
LHAIHANSEVRKMIDRARSGAGLVTETATTQDAQEERESLGGSNSGSDDRNKKSIHRSG